MRLLRFDDVGDSIELGARLRRVHSRFALWAAATHHTPHLRSFTKDSFHLPRVDSFAFTNCKGSDSILLLQWLEVELRLLKRQGNQEHQADMDLVQALIQVCGSSLGIFRLLYSHGLWLPRQCMKKLRDEILRVTRGYNYIAKGCLERGVPGFALKSTIHSMHHFAIDLEIALQNSAPCYPNFLMQECSQCEDFIGRIARVARATHSRTTAARCLQRHLVKTKMLLKKRSKKGS